MKIDTVGNYGVTMSFAPPDATNLISIILADDENAFSRIDGISLQMVQFLQNANVIRQGSAIIRTVCLRNAPE